MEENFDIREEQMTSREREFENILRPLRFSDFSGQNKVVENLSIFVQAARLRGEPLDHTLLHGPPGLGKTTLSQIIAAELGVGFKITSGPVLDKPGDLAGLLTSLEPNDVLFIDEIHRLSPIVEEYLYSAMEDYRIDIMIDKGPSARSIQIGLNPFTLVGATTRSGLLTAPLRARFGINLHLEYYDAEVLTRIILRSAKILNVPCDPKAAAEIAGRIHRAKLHTHFLEIGFQFFMVAFFQKGIHILHMIRKVMPPTAHLSVHILHFIEMTFHDVILIGSNTPVNHFSKQKVKKASHYISPL